jgi:digeranylgeranylglycerophospholipid reductase
MSNAYDIIVIGAGPAGSTAALTAAQEGASVLLIEEHPAVGLPVVCAEGLSRSTIQGYLDIKPEWISQKMYGSVIRGPDNEEFKVDYPGCGWVLNREVFDPALSRLAESNGAVIKTSTRALGVSDSRLVVDEQGIKKYYTYKLLIGADGMVSRVGTWMGIDTRLRLHEIDVCAQYVIEHESITQHYTTLVFGEKYAPGGYAWIFPRGKNTANVGLGISPLKTKKTAKAFLDEWVQKEFPDGTILREIYGGVPAKMLPRLSGDTFFLTGDAARLTDPLSGAGIANAVKSGVIAGRNAALRLKGKRDYFRQELKREILNEISYHHKVRSIYVKLTDRELEDIFAVGRRIFENKTVRDISIRHIVKEVIFSSPRLFRTAFRLLF